MKKGLKILTMIILMCTAFLTACGGGGGGGGDDGDYTVGGTISGLNGTVVLQNNGGDNLTITADGSFTFATAVADGSAYAVTVATQPSGQTCSVANGVGIILGADITNVIVTCSANAYTVGVTVSGLSDTLLGTLILQNNSGDDLTITANGSFTFATSIADGSPYAVTVKTQPAIQTCTVANGTGTISGANVTDVTVSCAIAPEKLTASDGADGDYFGRSVSVSSDGKTIVVGAIFDDGAKGSAYVYKWNGSAWAETKLTASDGAANDHFGSSVSVSSDGNTVVVGADGDDIGANTDQGSAYVYEWSGSAWAETKLIASDGAAGDYFGRSVSVSSDGNTVVVGADGDDIGANSDQGSAYLYQLTIAWFETKLTASDGAAGDYFGFSVSVSSDGKTIVVGAYGANSGQGSAYIYKWDGVAAWVETKLTASDGAAGDWFGNSVSVSSDGSTVVVGAYGTNSGQGSAYVYKWDGVATWIETKLTASDGAADDYFGASVPVSSDGKTIVVGAMDDDVGVNTNQGSAYIYKWDGIATWVETKLTASDGAAGDSFGFSVSVSSDGNSVVVGANGDDIGSNGNQGSVYVY